jgi:transcriptional regulator with XRE-family HTH domain
MDIPASLRAARTDAGLTQAALAGRAGTSQATISAYESGHKEPSVETLGRLLAATGSRLAVVPGANAVVRPSAEQLRRAGRTLVEVLALAELLPTRHEPELRFPPLPPPNARPPRTRPEARRPARP